MLCKNYHKIGFGTSLLGFAFVLFFSFFLNTHNTSAISDYSITIDDNNYSSFNVPCSPDCSSYHYLLVSDISATGFVYQISPYSSDSFARLVITHGLGLGSNISFYLYSFDNADRFIYSAANWSSGTSFKITLSENNPFGFVPSGDLAITANGQYDVTNYATATVNVPLPDPEVIPGDYHDDLQDIKQGIYVCGAILLVLYFFYCIYRMIIKGVKQ